MIPATGEKIITINGEPYTIRFTWRALAEIEHKHGDNPNLFDPDVIASVAAAGFKEKHPDMTPERIAELSPPLMPFVRDVQQALQWAYFGTESAPTEKEQKEGVKKNLKADGLFSRFVRLFKGEFPR